MDSPLFQYLFDETERRPMTVSELNAEVRSAVERGFSSVWVEGEVVNFLAAGSGHWYFTLNDGTSQIKCVCWKGTNYRVRFRPQNGLTVRIRGRLTFWEGKGEVKLNVETLEPAGAGALAAAYAQIKAKLEAEGLFSDELKRPIPFFPRRVCVITSSSGAAYHDIHNVLTRRARSVSILLVPALVQGEGAADSLRRAVTDVNRYNRSLSGPERIDVLIVGRGGGSAEDLWAFNDEMLARALRESAIPVISAVGHEIDWTICDLIADLRAATPSAAAEVVAAREEDILETLRAREKRLCNLAEFKIAASRSSTDAAVGGLRSNFTWAVQTARARLSRVTERLAPSVLIARSASRSSDLAMLVHRARNAVDRLVTERDERLKVEMAKLNALSPLAVLTRGYSITQTADGKVLRDAGMTGAGDKVTIRLDRGKLNAEVLSSE